MVTGVTGAVTLAPAWGFVLARLAHAWVHLGRNRIRHRLPIYLPGWVCVLALWGYVCAAVAHCR